MRRWIDTDGVICESFTQEEIDAMWENRVTTPSHAKIHVTTTVFCNPSDLIFDDPSKEEDTENV